MKRLRMRRIGSNRWITGGLLFSVSAIYAVAFLLGKESTAVDATTTYAKKEKPDPVAVNGPIFVGWPKPDVALVFTGEQNGYLEPCGCAGLENQKGGLRRRFTFLKGLRAKGWPVVAMDLGGQEQRFGK